MKKFPAPLFCAAFILLMATQIASARPSTEILTNASAVLSLSAEQASGGIEISIKGVVTAAEPDWGGRFFVQDSSGGVFVENISNVHPSPGDVVTVSGISAPGGYAPIITKPSWKKLGTAPLPQPKSVPIEQLMSGAEDSQRIEVSGIVRKVQLESKPVFQIELAVGGYFIGVFAPLPAGVAPQSLVGAIVKVKGTAATSFNAPLRHLIEANVYVPFAKDFVIEKLPEPKPFSEPLTPINSIGQYHRGRPLGYRVHVRGVVTYQRKGDDVFIQDDTGGLEITSSQDISLAPGDVIDAVGFPGVKKFLPVLEDAVLRKADEPRAVLQPKNVSIAELLEGLHHADFISLEGKVLDRLVEDIPPATGATNAIETTLVLQNSNLLFTAEAQTAKPDSSMGSIPIGSIVKVSGVCLLQSDEHGKIDSFEILLPGPSNVAIIAKPGWLTAQHLLIILSITLVTLVVAASWIIMVSKRNVALRQLMYDREQDQKELQKAHDTLEWRVKERTKQLKFQITARKEAEVRSKAILAERTRLAKELHDTLEQTLTGITLQLNTVAKLFQQNPETASYHLGLVRNMLRMSRVDLRRSIWDLRSRELEEFNLSKALSLSANRIADSAGLRVEVETKGTPRYLPEVIEENLLRIGQEAITNAVKHSGADWTKISLEFGVQKVILLIQDNGHGFAPENCAGPNDGHFGLLGMSERAKRLGGQILISSAPGKGTAIRVELPSERVQTPNSADEQREYEENIADSDFNS